VYVAQGIINNTVEKISNVFVAYFCEEGFTLDNYFP